MAEGREALLRKQSYDFCQAVIGGMSPPQLLETFFIPDDTNASQLHRPRITEHGPQWATKKLPFLGKTFVGSEGCNDYFSLLAQTLAFESDDKTFPPPDGFIVDPKAKVYEQGQNTSSGGGVVTVEGRARFRSQKTKRSWDERFMYRLSDFDDKGRLGWWEIWADPLSAWDAVLDVPLEGLNNTSSSQDDSKR